MQINVHGHTGYYALNVCPNSQSNSKQWHHYIGRKNRSEKSFNRFEYHAEIGSVTVAIKTYPTAASSFGSSVRFMSTSPASRDQRFEA